MIRTVLRDDRDGVAHLTLNRPDKLNALNMEVFQALEAYVKDVADRPVRAVVLRGAGRCFSAGHDLRDIATGEKPPRANYQSHVIQMLADLPLPVISAVHGHCYTGALELALAGDIILAAESAKFGDTHAKWALTPVWGLSQRLPRRVGTYKAREMMFTCRTYSGRQALEMGLANDCVADSAHICGRQLFPIQRLIDLDHHFAQHMQPVEIRMTRQQLEQLAGGDNAPFPFILAPHDLHQGLVQAAQCA